MRRRAGRAPLFRARRRAFRRRRRALIGLPRFARDLGFGLQPMGLGPAGGPPPADHGFLIPDYARPVPIADRFIEVKPRPGSNDADFSSLFATMPESGGAAAGGPSPPHPLTSGEEKRSRTRSPGALSASSILTWCRAAMAATRLSPRPLPGVLRLPSSR